MGRHLRTFWAVMHARNLEFVRDWGAMGWYIVFPIFTVGIMSVTLGDDNEAYKVGFYGAKQPVSVLEHVHWIKMNSLAEGEAKVSRFGLDLFISLEEPRSYWVNEFNANGYMLEKAFLNSDMLLGERQAAAGKKVRRIDWLFPGVLAMNIMFSCLMGVGYVIVRYRHSGVLQRLNATPLNVFNFLCSQIASRSIVVLLTTVVIYGGLHLTLDIQIWGSVLAFLLVYIVGGLSLISLGVLMATRSKNVELVEGMMDVSIIIMMFLSEVWFSLEGSPLWVQKLADFLPLTHITRAARAIALDGASLLDVMPSISILCLMTAVCLGLSVKLFRWN